MKILFGYDGSRCADSAIDELPRAGLPTDSEFLIVSAADVYPELPANSYEHIDPGNPSHILQRAHHLAAESVAQATTLVASAKSRIQGLFPAATITTQACPESPATALLRAAEEWRADLIVVGSQ